MNLNSIKGHPAMDYRAHVDGYRGFVRLATWGSIIIAIILILMAYFLV